MLATNPTRQCHSQQATIQQAVAPVCERQHPFHAMPPDRENTETVRQRAADEIVQPSSISMLLRIMAHMAALAQRREIAWRAV